MPQDTTQHTIVVDGNQFFLSAPMAGDDTLDDITQFGGIRQHGIRFKERKIFGDVVRLQAQAKPSDFALLQRIELKGPLSIGQLTGNDTRRCYDQYNVLAMWPGQITRGAQLLTPTQTGFPATFTGNARVFDTALGKIWVFGSGLALNDECLKYFVGSTTTWTDSTINASYAGDIKDMVGVCQIAGTMYALNKTIVDNGGGFTHCTFKSTDGVTWSPVVAIGTSETLSGVGTSMYFAVAAFNLTDGAIRITSLGFSTGNNISVDRRDTTGTAGWLGSGVLINDGTAAPRGLVNWINSSAQQVLAIGTQAGIYLYNSPTVTSATATKVHDIANPSGSYGGQLAIGPDGNVWFTDGPNVGTLKWNQTNILPAIVGPEAFEETMPNHPEGWAGVPSDALGDVTALCASKQKQWMYVAKGGTTSTQTARIYLYDIINTEWYCIYKHATAQRVITGIAESSLDDGTPRLHILVENAAAGTQVLRNFENITVNPLSITATFKYAATGTILDSQRDGGFGGLITKGWLTEQIDADNLTANEYLNVLNGQNNATPTNTQKIDSNQSPAEVWFDKTDASVGIGVGAKRNQVQFNFVGTAGATLGPTVRAMITTFRVRPQRSNGAIPYDIIFDVDMAASAANFGGKNTNAVFSALKTSANKDTLVKVTFAGGVSVIGELEMEEGAQEGAKPAQGAQQDLSRKGTIRCVLHEV